MDYLYRVINFTSVLEFSGYGKSTFVKLIMGFIRCILEEISKERMVIVVIAHQVIEFEKGYVVEKNIKI